MKIVTYRELENKDEILMLWFKSLGWGASPKWLEYFTRYDTQMDDGPIGMCGIVDNRLVSIVGVMALPTMTKQGKIEKVGGIFAIGTNPLYARHGYARKLLEAAENYIHKQGMKFSFLTTKKSLVAYKWYEDVGYENINHAADYPFMYKIFKKPNLKPLKTTEKSRRFNWSKLQEIYNWYAGKHCGFTLRSVKDIRSREMVGVFSSKLSVMTDNGYALMNKNCDSMVIKEIVAKNQKTYLELIRAAEARSKYSVIAFHPFDPVAQKAFTKAGYTRDPGNFITLMCKPLAKYRFSDYYDDSFMISKVDWF